MWLGYNYIDPMVLGYLLLIVVAFFGFRWAFKKKDLRYCFGVFHNVRGTTREETRKLPIINDQVEFEGGHYTCAKEAECIKDGLPLYHWNWRNPVPMILKNEVAKEEKDAVIQKDALVGKGVVIERMASIASQQGKSKQRDFLQFIGILAAAGFSLIAVIFLFQMGSKLDDIIALIKVKM